MSAVGKPISSFTYTITIYALSMFLDYNITSTDFLKEICMICHHIYINSDITAVTDRSST